MWSESTRDVNGTYDVEDSVSAFIRTTGPVITLEGAWAQNIEEEEQYLDFIGTKAGIRLQYCGNYKIYGVRDGELFTEEVEVPEISMFQREIDAFLQCVRTGEKERSHIDYAIKTSKIMEGIYESSRCGHEIIFD